MKKFVQFRDFHWLKRQGAIDSRSERILKKFAEKGARFLVVGSEGSGKNTVAYAIASWMMQEGREPIWLPTLHLAQLEGVARRPELRLYRRFLQAGHGMVLPVGYRKDYALAPYLPELPEAAKGFNLVVDVRHLPDGQRQVAQIFSVRGERLKCLYRSHAFADLQIQLAA
jgi:hypothetical protein